MLKNEFIIAIVEVANIKGYDKSGDHNISVITEEDHMIIRYLFAFNSGGSV